MREIIKDTTNVKIYLRKNNYHDALAALCIWSKTPFGDLYWYSAYTNERKLNLFDMYALTCFSPMNS
jgi:hypothetical protein